LPYGSTTPSTDDITFTKTHANATVEVTRNTSSLPTSITVTVTAEDETVTQNYILNFTENQVSGLQQTQSKYKIISNNGNLIISDVLNSYIQIYSATGQLIYFNKNASNEVSVPIDKGVYLVKTKKYTTKYLVK